MKYAKFSDDFLSDFRLDDNGETLVLTDKRGYTRAVKLLPYEERLQGEWIMQRHDLDGCFYTCSNCGRMIRVPLFIDDPEDNETLADYPFCHCGADMRKGGAE